MKIFQAFPIILALIIFTSCGERIEGNGNVTDVEHALPTFHAIHISGMFEVELVQEKGKSGIIVVTDDNLHEHITIEVENEKLEVGSEGKFLQGEDLKIIIRFSELTEIDLAGAVQLRTKNQVESNELELDISGAAQVDLDVITDRLEIEVSGAAEIELSGEAEMLEFNVSGAGKIQGFDLATRRANLDVTGAGDVEISVSEKLEVNITGGGDVTYKGDPDISKSVTGAGSIKKAVE